MIPVVGEKINIGSEANVRMHGNSERTADGKIVTPSIGHKGQLGSDFNFPDTSDHVIKVTDVEENEDRVKITKQCSCGLEWTYKERTQQINRRNVFENK